jgi:hypothetical protein
MVRFAATVALMGICLPLLSLSPLSGCKEEAKKQLYFNDLKPPLGVGKVEIISDVSMNPATGGEITVLGTVEPNVDRDELDRLLQSLLRQASVRRGFQMTGKPEKVDIRFYTDKKAAEAGGANWLARVEQTGVNEPTFTNKQKPPLLKWVKQAMGKMQEFTQKDLKPQILADPDKMAVELTWPFVEHDGKGMYVETLSHEKATTEFSSIVITLFEKIAKLNKFTFIGKHNDQVVMRIVLTREQFTELNIKQEEELLGAFQGQFIELILSKEITEKKVSQKVRKQRRKVYKEKIFGRLPEGQVELIKDLR